MPFFGSIVKDGSELMDLGEGIRKAIAKLTGKAVIDESVIKATVKDIQRSLLLSDVNIELVYALSKRIEERSLKEKPIPGRSMNEHVSAVVYEELTKLMGEGRKLEIKKQRIMMLGLFGSGKTTQIGKVANYLKQRGLSVGVIAADMMRPAAYEQLEQISKQVGCIFFGLKGKRAAEVVAEGLNKLKTDVVIIDTSGRDALDDELTKELKGIDAVAHPDERILVMSADIGQVAKKQAEEFDNSVGLTGVIITKMDGSGKGGGALSACAVAGAKIIFIGIGEKIGDIEEFNAAKFVGRLLGVPDFEALIKKMKEAMPEGMEAGELPEKFDINTFYNQLKAARRMGPLKGMFEAMGMMNVPKEALEQGEEKMDKYEAVIGSMTKAERADPDLLRKNPSRIVRIANGSGVDANTVREFVNQFGKMKKLYEQLQKNKGMQNRLERMLKGGKGLGL